MASRPNSRSRYHSPSTVEELTAQNVHSIAQLEKAQQRSVSPTDRIAQAITGFCGSMSFIWVHVAWFAGWILANTTLPLPRFDPFPFSLLTLIVSLEAIFLSTFIMIAENRQERVSERRSHLDLQINLLAEQEGTKILSLLSKIARKLNIDPTHDPDIAVLEQATRPEQLARQIEQTEKKEG